MSSGLKKRFLDPAAIDRGLEDVASLAASEGLRVLLVGGVALQQYGSDRLTVDLDVVSDRLPASLPAGVPLTFGGTSTRTARGTPLDWIVREDDYASVYDEALGFGRRVEGVPIPVASAEYLAAMKLVAGRTKDIADLETLAVSGELDVPNARRMIKRLLGPFAADAFDRVIEEAAWRAGRPGR